MPNPYDQYDYDAWPEGVWSALYADQEAYWYHFMLWRMATWTQEELSVPEAGRVIDLRGPGVGTGASVPLAWTDAPGSP